MRSHTTAGGRSLLLLDPGERAPKPTAPDRRQAGESPREYADRSAREYPARILRRRGEFWYQIHPETSSKQPRDPATGDVLKRGSTAAAAEKSGRQRDDRPDQGNRRGKAIANATAKRKCAPAKASTIYPLSGGGTTPIALNPAKGRKPAR